MTDTCIFQCSERCHAVKKNRKVCRACWDHADSELRETLKNHETNFCSEFACWEWVKYHGDRCKTHRFVSREQRISRNTVGSKSPRHHVSRSTVRSRSPRRCATRSRGRSRSPRRDVSRSILRSKSLRRHGSQSTVRSRSPACHCSRSMPRSKSPRRHIFKLPSYAQLQTMQESEIVTMIQLGTLELARRCEESRKTDVNSQLVNSQIDAVLLSLRQH